MLILPPFHVATDFYCLLSARSLLIVVTHTVIRMSYARVTQCLLVTYSLLRTGIAIVEIK